MKLDYRFYGGRYIHDGDCHFWGFSVCTCGLLHKLKILTNGDKFYPSLYKDCTRQYAILEDFIWIKIKGKYTMKTKGLLKKKADEIEQQLSKSLDSKKLIEIAINNTPELKEFKNPTAEEFLQLPYLTAYKLTGGTTPETVIAFVFPVLTKDVLEFLVRAAHNRNLKGLMSFTSNVVLTKAYKF